MVEVYIGFALGASIGLVGGITLVVGIMYGKTDND
jgi:hypothetical protein